MSTTLPIVTKELARRIEQAHLEAIESRFWGIEKVEGNPMGVEVRRFGPVGAYRMTAQPAPIPNLALGVTVENQDRLDELLDWFDERRSDFLLGVTPPLADQSLLRHLSSRGLVQTGFMSVTYGLPQSELRVPASVTVQSFGDDELPVFARLVNVIQEIPEDRRSLWEKVRAAEFVAWRGFIAFVEGIPAGHAAMSIRGGIASLGFARTNPRFQEHGCQQALLRQRLADAEAEGCELVISGAEPGTSSERNLQRAGMRIAYTEATWSRAAPA